MSRLGSPADGGGQSLAGGFAWMAVAGLVTKVATLGAHVILGWLLTPDDFGLYALAAGLYVLLLGLQSGGVRVALVSRGRHEASRDLKNALLISAVTHLFVASVLWVGAPFAASIYGEPPLMSLLRVMAVAVALSIPWVVGGAVLQNNHQFRRLAGIELTDGVGKAVLTIAFAASGLGAMSLVLPLPVLALFRSCAGLHAIAREWHPEQQSLRRAGELARDGGWIIAATLAHALLTQGDYLGLGLALSTSMLGIYYFAYQVPGQLGPLVASRLGDVLVPGLVAQRSSGRQMGSLAERVTLQLAVVLTLVGCVLAVSFPFLEAILWRGRWEDAIVPTQALSLLLVLRLLHTVPKSIMQAQRRFRELFVWTLFGGVGLVGVAVAIGAATMNLTAIATAIGSYLAIVTLVFLVSAFRGTEVDVGSMLSRILFMWALSTGITVGIISLQGLLDGMNPWLVAPIIATATGGSIVGSWRLMLPFAYDALRSLVCQSMSLRPMRR